MIPFANMLAGRTIVLIIIIALILAGCLRPEDFGR